MIYFHNQSKFHHFNVKLVQNSMFFFQAFFRLVFLIKLLIIGISGFFGEPVMIKYIF